MTQPIRAVWFDIGETLVDESEIYGAWADTLGVPRHTFSAVLGAVVARDGDLIEVFRHFRPDFDLASAPQNWRQLDLYTDARRCLQALKDAGYFVGVAGNQPARASRFLRGLALPCDVLAASEEWGVAKPDADFFARIIEISGCAAEQIAYVGDRLDNDVIPADRAGLVTVWVRRGPWGHLQQPDGLPEGVPAMTVENLDELAARLTATES